MRAEIYFPRAFSPSAIALAYTPARLLVPVSAVAVIVCTPPETLRVTVFVPLLYGPYPVAIAPLPVKLG